MPQNCNDNFKTLDSSLIRPGRIDKIIHFDYMKKTEIKNMFEYFIEGDFEVFWNKIDGHKIVASKLQSFLYQYRKKDIMKNIDRLIEDSKKSNMMYL